jgi:hypothetical protein
MKLYSLKSRFAKLVKELETNLIEENLRNTSSGLLIHIFETLWIQAEREMAERTPSRIN